MRKLFRLGFALVFVALVTPAARPLRAQQQSAVALTIRAGFDGFVHESMWLPVRVTVSNDGPDVDGILQIEMPRYDGSTVTFARPIELPRQSRKEVFMYVISDGYMNAVQVNLLQGDEVLADAATRVSQLTQTDLLFGVLAGNPSAFQMLADVDPVSGQGFVAQLSLDELPPASAAWRSLDVLVVSDADTGALAPAQHAALETWLAGGGRLIVAGGAGWQRATAGIGDLLPVNVASTTTIANLGALGAYALETPPSEPAQVTTGSVARDAEVLLTTEGVPLIVERSVGYGSVDYLAFDPALAPFSGWRGMEGLYRNLLAVHSQRPSWAHALRNWYNAGEAVNSVPGVDLPSTIQLCAFAGAYIFVVGPLNFILLRRMKKREYAWLTVPALVVLFSGISYLAGFTFRGTRPILHRLSVVQLWEGSQRAQVEMLVGVFSPRRARYDVEVEGDALPGPLPSNSFTGPAGSSIGETTLEMGDAAVVRGMQVEGGAIKSFVVHGQAPAPQFASQLAYQLGGAAGGAGPNVSLSGTITNLSDLALRDVVVLAPSAVQAIGDVGPGQELTVNLSLAAGQASPASPIASAQVLPPGVVAGPFLGGGYGSRYDSTIDDILGGSGSYSYYDDRETYRRYSLLQWLVDPYSGGSRGTGVFLVGWANAAPLRAEILERAFTAEDETLYIVSLTPQISASGGTIAIPPGLMTWELLDPGSGSGDGPYDVYLYEGAYALRFVPLPDLELGAVQALTLHLHSYGARGAVPLNISLRDQRTGDWETLGDLTWGDTAIPTPWLFVGGDGRIDVRVENPRASGRVNIERLDFTLEVER